MATRACAGCSAFDVRGEGCCLRLRRRISSRRSSAWRFMSCLSCCSCLPTTSSSTQDQAGGGTSSSTPTADSALLQLSEITLAQLDQIIPIIEHELNHLDPDAAGSSSQASISHTLTNILAKWEEQKQICSSFITSLPKELTDEVAGNGRSLFMPLLTKALSGVGGVHWLGIGFGFIAWSLDNISNIIENRAESIEILRRSVNLLKSTKRIWQATNIDNVTRNDILQDSVEKVVRCVIFCTSNLEDAWILRCLKATSVKDALSKVAKELEIANAQNMSFGLTHMLESEAFKFGRQITHPFCDDDIVGGQEEVMQDAVKYLKTSSDVTMALCLHGMGGIGKSFLGLKIFSQFQKCTYRDCHVELKFETWQGELCAIQKEIITKVCRHPAPDFSKEMEGKQIMEMELKKIDDPIFLYVDNVLEHIDLLELLPKASHFPKGSRILITSRGEYIKQGIVDLGITDHKLIEVRKLEKQAAQQLLWQELESEGEHLRDDSEVESLEERVLELCDGLPLALVVVGKYIRHDENGIEDVEVWREVVEAMQKAEPLEGGVIDRLYSRIKFSIQHLHPNVIGAFFDIIFFVDCVLPGWITWGRIERLVGKKYLKVLSQRALVRKSEDSYLEIHDVLKAMGKRMVEDDKQELRIAGMSRFEEHINKALDKVVALHDVTVDAYQLNQMPGLRLLNCVEVELGQGHDIEAIKLRHLRVVLKFRCSAARVFDWSECASLKEVNWVWDDAPSVSNLVEVFKHDKNISMGLEVLNLRGWSELKDVDVIETFTSLKELELHRCNEIESLPEGISRLTGLNTLLLVGCKKLKCLPQGISGLKSLNWLNLYHCGNVQSLPDGLTTLTGLTGLHLGLCSSLQSIPEGIGNLTGLTYLTLDFCSSLQSIPEGIGNLTGLRQLGLDHCSSLQSIPERIGNLTAVTGLTLRWCEGLGSIPEGATSLMSGKTTLSFERCTRIKYLPEGITRLVNLKQLDLGSCRSLRSLPEGVSGLTGLTKLNLRECTRLQALPEEIASLSSLIELNLSGCRSLRSLPEGVSGLTGLMTSLDLQGCRGLSCLTGLRNLNLSGCESLQMQFMLHEISKLTGLVQLDLSHCKRLQSIEGLTTLKALTILKLNNCTELELLPEGFTGLTSLDKAYLLCKGLSGCRSLKSLPKELGRSTGGLAHELPAADLSYCESLKSLPQSIESFTLLKRLNLGNCTSLESLPQSIGSFTLLQKLDLENCTSLESLPEGVTKLSNLAELSLLGCRSLQRLPARGLIGGLTNLRELKLGECAILQPLLEEVWWSSISLKVLELSGCEDLQSLPQGITSLMTSLQELSLSGCKNFQLLPQGMANWTALRSLDLSGCKSLQSLPEELTALTAIRVLDLSGCEGLQSLPHGIFTSLAGSLEWLNMSECGGLQLQESHGITTLTCLSGLDLSESEHIEFVLSHAEHGLAGLVHLNLSGCRSLQSQLVWETILSFKCLCDLNVSGWETMQALPEGIGSLGRLEFLNLSKCSSLLSLPESVKNLRSLYSLSLAECKSLQSLGPGFTSLARLNVLDLSGCSSLSLTEEITNWISGIKNLTTI